jgi:hypothetical protein
MKINYWQSKDRSPGELDQIKLINLVHRMLNYTLKNTWTRWILPKDYIDIGNLIF